MKQETLEEVAENYAKSISSIKPFFRESTKKTFIDAAKYQQEQDKNRYSEEDMKKAYSIGWITRERFDDLSPDIIYPKGLDYEEKQDYAFNLWFEQFKKK